MIGPALLILAAGMGSRYGGLKQIDPVGPSGEILLDYAVFDAVRAGFDRVVFVIRPDIADAFRETIGSKYEGVIEVDYVQQTLDALPEGFSSHAKRAKPWGTGHAVWCAREALTVPFMVIGADDFFGADAFAQLGGFLSAQRAEQEPLRFAMAGYRLDRTLSEHGAVSRGICEVANDGMLRHIEEHTAIDREKLGQSGLTGEEIVSMNCFGFTPGLFASLDRQLRDFLEAHGNDPKAEFYLPTAVSTMIGAGIATVKVLPVRGDWFGVTHREERARVQAAIAALVEQGIYPPQLFGGAKR